ncbi:hypothetical protein [Bradyrhizobium sp. I71]|uniref:hypothetical protein n=1 Tax=Bradyrhizobium sp. I71 TaxID=2590772 RepID=UPI001EF975DA|nr:hypothetical protein [Bradyrhizobium sp. I71]ULK96333.1 hypothetical protein FJV43_26865 [Bradyrhizobium sp. I71]
MPLRHTGRGKMPMRESRVEPSTEAEVDATFCMASARKQPISVSPLAEMVPTWAISSLEVIFLACDLIGDDRVHRKVSAADGAATDAERPLRPVE